MASSQEDTLVTLFESAADWLDPHDLGSVLSTCKWLPRGWLWIIRAKVTKEIRSRTPIPCFPACMDMLVGNGALDVFGLSRMVRHLCGCPWTTHPPSVA